MTEWITPKTDWYGAYSNGVYSGDRFNYNDYNRIKNNLEYLHDLAESFYNSFDINDVGDDKEMGDFYYADEINAMEENLVTITNNSLNIDYGDAPTYEANGLTPDYTELNRLESAILDLYEKLNNAYAGRRKLTFYLGDKEVF